MYRGLSVCKEKKSVCWICSLSSRIRKPFAGIAVLSYLLSHLNLQQVGGSWLMGMYALIHKSWVNSVKQWHSHTVMLKSSLWGHSIAGLCLSRIRQDSSRKVKTRAQHELVQLVQPTPVQKIATLSHFYEAVRTANAAASIQTHSKLRGWVRKGLSILLRQLAIADQK